MIIFNETLYNLHVHIHIEMPFAKMLQMVEVIHHILFLAVALELTLILFGNGHNSSEISK